MAARQIDEPEAKLTSFADKAKTADAAFHGEKREGISIFGLPFSLDH